MDCRLTVCGQMCTSASWARRGACRPSGSSICLPSLLARDWGAVMLACVVSPACSLLYLGCRDRLACGGIGLLAVQSRVPAEQGAIFRARHRQCRGGARPGRCANGAALGLAVAATFAGFVRTVSRHRQVAGALVWRVRWWRGKRLPRGSAGFAAQLLAGHRGVLGGRAGSRPLVWLGAVWYCIYLLNEPVQKVVGVLLALATAGNAALFTTFWLPAALAAPVLAAWCAARMDRGSGAAVGACWHGVACRRGGSGQRRINVQ